MGTTTEVTNIQHAALAYIRQTPWLIAVMVAVVLAAGVGLFLFSGLIFHILAFAFVGLSGLYGFAATQARRAFWQHFARDHDWQYQRSGSIADEQALLFERGHDKKMRNVVSGSLGDRTVRVFEYTFSVGHGKHQSTHHYTVFEFSTTGRFPHVYLNHHDNTYDASHDGTRIPAPSEFEDSYSIVGPEQYESEILELFTPDVLQHLLDADWAHDVELVNGEMLIIRHSRYNTRAELDEAWQQARALAEYLGPKLDRADYEQIGDYDASLR